MATAGSILKGEAPKTIGPDETVLRAARLMASYRIGAMLVVDGETLLGIVSERDVLVKIVATGRDPVAAKVREVMTPDPITVGPDEPLAACLALLEKKGFRHLPVTEGKRVIGILSIRDLLAVNLSLQKEEIHWLKQYMGQA